MSKKLENEVKRFAYDFMEKMGWKPVHINRIKISNMRRYKGLCITEDCESVYIILSEHTHDNNKDFFATLIHELIHAHLLINKHKFMSHHKHGKMFKRYAKKVEKKTNGYYTVEEIVK
jgi:hypothetical protein